ncbi:MAG: hypothetical protein KA180_12845 [Gemmatimonadales bacterium]|nr:hypothetical protein [Gemmatimonadales bacterium]
MRSAGRRRLAALALGALLACAPARPFVVVGYYPGDASAVHAYPVGDLTHLIYSFGHLQGAALAIDSVAARTTIPALVALKRRHPDLKVLLSLGGWGGCGPCSEVFATDSGRRAFARSVGRLGDSLGTDGIDLDWEYPAIPGFPGHRHDPADREHFTALVAALREALGPRGEITFAAGGFTEYLQASVDWARVMPLVDRVHLMSYDLVHGVSTRTGHHTPLYSTPAQVESVDHAVRLLDSLGVPRRKVVIGAAFYARVFGEVDSVDGGRYRPGRFVRGVSWRNLGQGLGPGFVRQWDSVAAAPWAYDAAAREYATYDDPRSVGLKTRYALDHGLGGIMFWQLLDDLPAGGLLEAITRERRGPR